MRSISSVCVKMKCDGVFIHLMSIYDNEILSHSLELIFIFKLSVNFSYVCFIYAEIFEKILDGDLEVSLGFRAKLRT